VLPRPASIWRKAQRYKALVVVQPSLRDGCTFLLGSVRFGQLYSLLAGAGWLAYRRKHG
jgi:hypothetical protein